jgi:ATP-dependent RNA helicase SUPV3L1/SUV3
MVLYLKIYEQKFQGNSLQNISLKEQLNSFLNCDIKSLYPLARSMNRELYFFVGPTNSGKTYNAMQELKKANTGVYLAPLRLLALENYEDLIKENIETSLVTGEEQIFNEDAAHICSTIEMLDFNLSTDVCVIDEVQMLDDEDRGWAWVNAILGAPAKKIIMTGSVNALDAVKKIATYLDEPLHVKKFKRKTELEVLDEPVTLKNIEPGTALIAFSRNDVLYYKSKLQKHYKVSIIYGNLSPEVRSEEARRFREHETQILIATDAIAMGLNLPIKTILFTTDTKFDGVSKRLLYPTEVIQIAGRAGRYGYHEAGHIGAIKQDILHNIQDIFYRSVRTIKPPFKVKASNTQMDQLSQLLKTHDLRKILDFFAKNMSFDGPFIAANISSMIEASNIVESHHQYLTLDQKYILSQAPLNTRSPLISKAFQVYLTAIGQRKKIAYKLTIDISQRATSQDELLKAEDEVKKISLYLWLSYKLPDIFIDEEKARDLREKVNLYIEKSLKSNRALKRPDRMRRDKPQNRQSPRRNSRGGRRPSSGSRSSISKPRAPGNRRANNNSSKSKHHKMS